MTKDLLEKLLKFETTTWSWEKDDANGTVKYFCHDGNGRCSLSFNNLSYTMDTGYRNHSISVRGTLGSLYFRIYKNASQYTWEMVNRHYGDANFDICIQIRDLTKGEENKFLKWGYGLKDFETVKFDYVETDDGYIFKPKESLYTDEYLEKNKEKVTESKGEKTITVNVKDYYVSECTDCLIEEIKELKERVQKLEKSFKTQNNDSLKDKKENIFGEPRMVKWG
jgi:hypothetical protein